MEWDGAGRGGEGRGGLARAAWAMWGWGHAGLAGCDGEGQLWRGGWCWWRAGRQDRRSNVGLGVAGWPDGAGPGRDCTRRGGAAGLTEPPSSVAAAVWAALGRRRVGSRRSSHRGRTTIHEISIHWSYWLGVEYSSSSCSRAREKDFCSYSTIRDIKL